MRSIKCLMVSLVIIGASARAESTATFSESLQGARDKANGFSPTLKSAQAGAEAASFAKEASFDHLIPALTFEGSYFYQTDVPTVTLPGMGALDVGAHNNYSYGPVLRYNLFDGRQASKTYQSNDLMAQGKAESLKANRRDLDLNVNIAYFKAQLALKNLVMTADSLKLSQAQGHDIDLRFQAGSSSKLDQYSAHRDVVNYQLKFQQAQADLAATLRDLFALTGENGDIDVSSPAPAELQGKLPPGVPVPSAYINLDSQSASLKVFAGFLQSPPPDGQQPQVKALILSAKSSELAAQAQKGGLWPKLDFFAKGEEIYPNYISPTKAWNNEVGVNLTVPLWLGDATLDLAKQRTKEALSAKYQSDQKLTDLQRDYLKTRDLVKNLGLQKVSNTQFVEQTEQISRLTFQSYKAGKVNYLDVQTSNLRLLEAHVTAAQTDQQYLVQLAQLEYLSSSKESSEGDHHE